MNTNETRDTISKWFVVVYYGNRKYMITEVGDVDGEREKAEDVVREPKPRARSRLSPR